jgi:hypothetical protein
MSKVSELNISIQEDIMDGRLSFAEIAAKHEVPLSWVDEVVGEMVEQESFLFPEPSLQSVAKFSSLVLEY